MNNPRFTNCSPTKFSCVQYNLIGAHRLFYDQFTPIGIIDWSPVIEQILEKGRTAIKQAKDDKFTTLVSLLIHGL